MKVDVLKKDGSASGEKVDLPKEIFDVEINEHAVYLAVKAQLANSRQGTSSTKTRSLVSGGGRKPWKQKGRGVARAGSSRSPVWVGGGRVFGPQPRDYSLKLPKKMRRSARFSVLTSRVKEQKLKVVEDFKLDKPKTKEVAAFLSALGLAGSKTLLLLSEHNDDFVRAGRNIPNLNIRVASTESTYDLLNCGQIVLQKGGIEKMTEVAKS